MENPFVWCSIQPLSVVVRSLALLLPLIAGIAAATSSPMSASAASVRVYATVATDEPLELRLRPDRNQKVVTTLAPGTKVELIQGPNAGGWYKVDAVGIPEARRGWTRGKDLRFDQSVRATSDLDLYAGASDATAPVASVRRGTVLPVVGPMDGDYLLVRSGEVVGYAAHPAVASADEAATDPSGERWVDVNRTTREVRLMIGSTVVDTFSASLGRDQGEGFYATASGSYRVYSKVRDLSYTPYANAYIMYWVGFDPSRDNGFHGWTMDANGNVIDGGWGPTGGCIATKPEEAAVIYDFVELGTRVEIHW